MKRKLEQLNLLDDFLFGSVLSYAGIGEEFCRKILKILLNVDVYRLRVVPQKVYYGSDTDKHGTRLDVYIEDDGGAGTVYDVEPDRNDSRELIDALPRRVRFYHSKIDGRSLKSGDDYSNLKKVIILMIMPYDPFERDRIVYTIRNKCEEEPDMDYDDGTEVALEYMKVYERERMIESRGETRGVVKGEVKIIRNMLKSMELSQISESTGLESKYVEKILAYIRQYPKESDAEISDRILASGNETEAGRRMLQ